MLLFLMNDTIQSRTLVDHIRLKLIRDERNKLMDQGRCESSTNPSSSLIIGASFSDTCQENALKSSWTPKILILQYWMCHAIEENTFLIWAQYTQWRKYVGRWNHSFSPLHLHGREFAEVILLRLLAKKKLNCGLPPLLLRRPINSFVRLREVGTGLIAVASKFILIHKFFTTLTFFKVNLDHRSGDGGGEGHSAQ